jgi:hypothetical protein
MKRRMVFSAQERLIDHSASEQEEETAITCPGLKWLVPVLVERVPTSLEAQEITVRE